MGRWRWALCVLVGWLFAALPGHAFCGFYVNTGKDPLVNDATRVVLMRAGQRTVLSIQNDYSGPLENFALVVPVPVILERENVKTLSNSIFDRVDRLTSPRLVEYWEQDPCPAAREEDKEGGTGTRAKGEEGSMGASNHPSPKVVVEREFKVDEYDVVILSARDASALETWLHENNYQIPEGAEPYLRPYVLAGSKFFVAKVDISRVHFRWNRAQLSPLRFHYDTPDFTLPVRLGLINSSGTQDLLVYILANERYETANYENLFIPTNLNVKDEVRTRFGSFYTALFQQTVADHPHSVVTEYSWSSSSCDPCPEGANPLSDDELKVLGGDVVSGLGTFNTILTRLHARYGKETLGDDLVFKAAAGVEGGRETTKDKSGPLLQTAIPASASNFQGRYIIHHLWNGPALCSSPQFGQWGGNPYAMMGEPANQPPPHPISARGSATLKVADYTLPADAFAVDAQSGAGGGRDPRSFLERLGFDQWNGDNWLYLELIVGALSLVVAAVVARRKRLGVLKVVGLTLLADVVGLCAAFACERSGHAHYVITQDGPAVITLAAPRRHLLSIARRRSRSCPR